MSIQTIRVVFVGTFPNASTRNIDLGVVSLRDAAINGRNVPLVPYAEGRLIKSITYTPGGSTSFDQTFEHYFMTPNTIPHGGFACPNIGYDTLGILNEPGERTDLTGQTSQNSQIADVGPLVVGIAGDLVGSFLGVPAWTANNQQCLSDIIIDANYHIQKVTTAGVSGATIPDFDDDFGTTQDNTVTWNDLGLLVDDRVHCIVEVYEGISPMPPYIATLEWVNLPTNTPAGEIISEVIVLAIDQYSQPCSFQQEQKLQMGILGAGTLTGQGTTSINMDANTGTFSAVDLSIAEPGTYILRAALLPGICDPIFSPPFIVT